MCERVENDFLKDIESVYEPILKRVTYKLHQIGEYDENQIRDCIHDSLIYYEPRNKVWKSDAHKVNAISLKAHSLYIDHLRKQDPEIELDLLDNGGVEMNEDEAIARISSISSSTTESNSIDPEDECIKNVLIESALSAMTPQQRMIYEDTLEGYTPQEISERRNLSIDQVYKSLQRGMAAAKRKLQS